MRFSNDPKPPFLGTKIGPKYYFSVITFGKYSKVMKTTKFSYDQLGYIGKIFIKLN